MELQGEILKIKDTQTFQSGFQKRQFILKTNEQYPQELPIELFKDKIDILNDFSKGDKVKVGYNLQGGKYTNKNGEEVNTVSLVAWFVNHQESTGKPNAHKEFGQGKTKTAKPTTQPENPLDDEEDEDLPF